MKTYTNVELKEIIELHQKWLDGDEDGVRANLTDANLCRANLTSANLTSANLSSAKLTSANLYRADLYRANLTDANLTDANLCRANLTSANLTSADLTSADLYRANLTDANLTSANLTSAKLWGTIGNNNEIKSLQEFTEYEIAYTKDRLQIGCKNYSFQEWWEFTDEEILAMDGKKALSFWKNYKETINNTIESNPAV